MRYDARPAKVHGTDCLGLSTYLPVPLPGPARRHRRRAVNARAIRRLVELRVRRLVAEHLGVDVEELRPEVALIDELAVDSLDLVELTLALEDAFDIALPEDELAGVCTYGDLTDVTVALVRASRQAEADRAAGEWATGQ